MIETAAATACTTCGATENLVYRQSECWPCYGDRARAFRQAAIKGLACLSPNIREVRTTHLGGWFRTVSTPKFPTASPNSFYYSCGMCENCRARKALRAS